VSTATQFLIFIYLLLSPTIHGEQLEKTMLNAHSLVEKGCQSQKPSNTEDKTQGTRMKRGGEQ
jgi:hypothetical protein